MVMATIEIKLSLDTEDQARLIARAQQQGLSLEVYLQAILESLARPLDARKLRSLPREERNRILAAQAEAAAALYAADLAKLVEERELTAFTALDGEPIALFVDASES